MKPKNFSKKLSLNKITVAHIGNNSMDAIKGGNLGTSEVDPEACATMDTWAVCTAFTFCQGTCGGCNTYYSCNSCVSCA